MSHVSIAPSLLAVVEGKDSIDIDLELSKAIKNTPSTDIYHIDVMDGKFVPQRTVFIDYKITSNLKKLTDATLDVHLMTEKPELLVDGFAEAGAGIITFHHEAAKDSNKVIQKIKNHNIKAGISINPATSISEIKDLLGDIDLVLLMSVVPGKCGQGYIETVTEKIAELQKIKEQKGYSLLIQVDGGIKVKNSYKPINAGADILVSGSGVYSSDKPDNAIKRMREHLLIGSDHGGFELKAKIKDYLNENSLAFVDIGSYSTDSCDHPLIAEGVAKPISKGEVKRGILVCGTGLGMSIGANRFKGVRATVLYDKQSAQMSREHNDSNLAVFGERTMDHDTVLEMLEIWLKEPASTVGKYQKRNLQFNGFK